MLEQELKAKEDRIKELEKENLQCKDYQKAVMFQEKELQESRTKLKDLKQQLEERDKLLQQHKGKISIHAKELAEAKADLQEANSIIGIHRANIESLKSELSSMKGSGKEKLILAGEEPESDQFARPGSPVYVLEQVHVSQHEKKKNNLYLILPYTVVGQNNY